MMQDDTYKSRPVGSLLTRERSEEERYLNELPDLPPSLISLLMSAKTGAFIRGLVRNYDLALEKAAMIAFMVLQISFGEKTLLQLSTMLASDLQLPLEKAQSMAQEIERELFAPIMLELNAYLTQKRKITGGSTSTPVSSSPSAAGGARNVLDLKSQPRPPQPPAIPQR
ncbi:MAG: hypothetical protein WEA04_01680 [Candidatus Andersenbacteria bacterium]